MLVNNGVLYNSSVGRTGTKQISSSASTLVLDLQNRIDSILTVSPALAQANVWSIINDFNSLEFTLLFEMASLDAQTFPADWQVTNLIGNWDGVTWTPLDLGKYQAHGIWDGTAWNVEIIGLFTL